MPETEATFETIHKIDPATHHHTLLTSENGNFLGFDGELGFFLTDRGNDQVIWEESTPTTFEHSITGVEVSVIRGANSGAVSLISPNDAWDRFNFKNTSFSVDHGPERLPSEYLCDLQDQGWVCLTNVLSPTIVEELERVACTDRFEGRKYDPSRPAICQNPAVAITAAEPISLWVIRQYMQIDDIRLSHAPAFAILTKDDGERNVQGWHSDFPYHWGVPAKGRVPTPSGKTVLGVQRNVCVSDFTKIRGATIFKLGSHALDSPPPQEWGDATTHSQPGYRAENGLPYGGPEADIIEAPGGSIILYDSRTWHRQGVNRSDSRRAAMLQAMTPMYIMPKNDTSMAYKAFVESEVFPQVNDRVKSEIRNLMVHQFIGPGGTYAITPDRELTKLVKEENQASY